MASGRSPSCGTRGWKFSTEPTFAGQVALVTGASGGIGTAMSRALARSGAAVAVGYGRSAEPAERLVTELSSDGYSAAAFAAEMADRSAPGRLVEQVEQRLGPVDLLVVSHGSAVRMAYEDVDAETFDRTVAINLRAPFLLAQAVLPGMRQRRFGRILFVSSTAAFRGGVIGPHYASSKAGLHGLTYFLAGRTAADGVTVNTIAPGFVETAMLPGNPAELGAQVPVGRVGRPEEVAALSLAILRNGYLTSHVIDLDGGMHPR